MERTAMLLRGLIVSGLTLALAGLYLTGGYSAVQTSGTKYMEPHFPSYLKPVKSADELMPQARALVRNRSALQGVGLGIVPQGATVLLVHTVTAEEVALQALKKALEERGVKPIFMADYELAGISKADAEALVKALPDHTAEDPLETRGWIEGTFPNPDGVKKWLKDKRPDLYDMLFPPAAELSPHLKEVQKKLNSLGGDGGVAAGIRSYLEKHPDVMGVFWGFGGSSYLRRYLHPYEDKLLGLFLWDNQWDILSEMSSYPGDVWQLAENQTLDPLAYIDKIQFTDPEGTNIQADLTEDQAERFERGVYHRGHMFMSPNQAYGRFGYSVIDYPGYQKDWLPPEPLVMFNGVLVATKGHGGFFPRMEVRIENSYVKEVKGGGDYGDLYREFLQYPHINDLTYPFYKHPGFFYVYEFALGTNPKAFRHPIPFYHGAAYHLVPERNRSGVFHIGTGVFVQHAPDSMEMPKEWLDFTRKNNLPIDHAFHMHDYFATYRVQLRNANRWVNLVENGHLTSLSSPEVRALASRYGDPDRILSEDWVPEIPGINAPGSYDDYAKDPWKYAKAQMDKIIAGTYEHYFPPKSGSKGATGR